MSNTLLLKGKGLSVGLFFDILAKHDSYVTHTYYEPKWWQIHTRHELRWQNVDPQMIDLLRHTIKSVDLPIKMEIF